MIKKKTVVNFILDESGSMTSVREATISGFNEYIQSLKNKGGDFKFSLTLFNTQTKVLYEAVDLKDVSELTNITYQPSGSTALYDAVCSTIDGVKKGLGKKDNSLVIILTDGLENASHEYTEVQMRKMVEELEAGGNWTFVYLGANQDSYAVAQKFGIRNMNNVTNFNASARGMSATMDIMSAQTDAYVTASASMGWNPQENNFYRKDDQDKLERTK